MIAGVLEIQMLANMARLQADMDSAKRTVSGAMGSIEKSVNAAKAALGALGIGLSAGYFASLVKGTIDAADNLNDLSQRLGIGIKDLAKWQLAASQSGASIESVSKGVKGLATYMTENNDKLKKAGITATDANGAMTQLADLFAAMPDGIQKTALATQLFGKAGLDLLPMLNLGSAGLAEMQEKAASYGEKMAKLAPAADKFNDETAELALNMKALGINIATYVVGPMTAVAQALNDMAAGGERAEKRLQFLSDAGHPVARALLAWGGLAKQLGLGVDRSIGYHGPKNAAGLPASEIEQFDAATAAYVKAFEARKRAAALLEKPGGAGKSAKSGFVGPLWDAADHAAWLAAQKAIAGAIEASNNALAEQDKRLGDQVAAANRALETYGLTEVQIIDLTLARLKENQAREEARDADAATLAYYEKEIDALKRIREAKAGLEAKETAKKAADDASKAWENFTRDLESSLTDALMRSFEAGDSFGEAFKNNLENLFKTMILKAAVQISVGTVAGAAQQALGINVGGAGSGGSSVGGVLDILSGGSSLYSAFTGATASSLGGLIGGSFGAGMQGASLAAGLAGPTTMGAGGAMGAGAMAATALPWVAGALAIASIFGGKLFGSKKPAAVEWGLSDTPASFSAGPLWDQYTVDGPFTSLTATGQHLKRNGLSMDSLKTSVSEPLAELDKVLAQYLDAGEISKVAVALMLGNEGEHGWSQAEVDGVMMRRLNRISDAIGGWVDELADTTTGTIQERYTQLAQILSIRGDAEMEQLANDMFGATGTWDYQRFTALAAGVSRFNDMFKTDAERMEDYSASMRKAFQGLNLAFPETREGFKALVEGLDTGTEAGFNLYATLLDLVPTMGAYYDALQAELDVKTRLTAMPESGFSSAVDYRRYQGVAANYDATLAGDYAYNIRLGAIAPGSAANGDLVGELRALRSDLQAQNLAIATNTQDTAKLLRRWNGDGMPETRVVA